MMTQAQTNQFLEDLGINDSGFKARFYRTCRSVVKSALKYGYNPTDTVVLDFAYLICNSRRGLGYWLSKAVFFKNWFVLTPLSESDLERTNQLNKNNLEIL